jgi:hypothetical protein
MHATLKSWLTAAALLAATSIAAAQPLKNVANLTQPAALPGADDGAGVEVRRA